MEKEARAKTLQELIDNADDKNHNENS